MNKLLIAAAFAVLANVAAAEPFETAQALLEPVPFDFSSTTQVVRQKSAVVAPAPTSGWSVEYTLPIPRFSKNAHIRVSLKF